MVSQVVELKRYVIPFFGGGAESCLLILYPSYAQIKLFMDQMNMGYQWAIRYCQFYSEESV